MTNKLKEQGPYVGPRPFESQHKEIFFGRKRETDEIISLIISHRVLVLYAQSGAGKTSLINASVIPALDDEGFDILPITRVRGLIPDDIKLKEVSNPYVYNSIISWAEEESKLYELTKTSIEDFLENRQRKEDEDGLPLPRIIIFDQFEELFTSYHTRWKDRKQFFTQVVQALEKDPLLRIIFTIREDYLAQIDPFSAYFPEKLRNRFRLECLRKNAALLAIKEPLTKTNLSISEEVAETLITDLLSIRVETYEGKIEHVSGEYVEPVQLQVVCESLWRDLPSDVTVITSHHLKAFGDVDQALTMFYEKSINDTINRTSIKEGDLRSWFEQTLITPAGTRGTVYKGKEKTGEILNEAIDLLEDHHIIRAERIKGGRWYELIHDRFIKPIQDSNEKWLSKRQEVEQARKRLDNWAVEWVRLGKETGGLLDEVELLEAKRWVKVLDKSEIGYSDDIKSLIKASDNYIKEIKLEKEAAHRREIEHAKALAKEQERRVEEQAKSVRRQRRFAVAFALLGIIAIVTALFAAKQRNVARKNANLAFINEEQARFNERQALIAKAEEEIARQIADTASKRANDQAILADARATDAEKARNDAEKARINAEKARINAEKARNESFSRELAAGAIYNLDKDPELSILLSLHAFSVIDSSDKNVSKEAEDALHRAVQASQIRVRLDHPNRLVSDVVFSPDGTYIATACGDGTARVWDTQTGKEVRTLYGR